MGKWRSSSSPCSFLIIILLLVPSTFVMLNSNGSLQLSGDANAVIVEEGDRDENIWSMYGGGPTNSRQSALKIDFDRARDRWNFETGGTVKCEPVIDGDQNIYFTGSDGFIYSLNSTGSLRWKYETGETSIGSPALNNDQELYVESSSGLYKITFDGNLIWDIDLNTDVVSSPMIGANGNIYFTALDGFLYSIYPNGTIQWRSNSGRDAYSHCALSPQGNVIVSSSKGYLLCFDPQGNLLWNNDIGILCRSEPSIDIHGNIYIGSNDTNIYCFGPDGTLSWKTELIGGVTSSPAIYNNERIIARTSSGFLYCLDLDGSILWSKDVEYLGLSNPVISDEGRIIINAATIMCLDIDGDIIWTCNSVLSSIVSPSLGQDLILIGSSNKLLAVGPYDPTYPEDTVFDQIGNSVRISWSVPILDGGVEILNYVVKRESRKTGEIVEFSTEDNDLEFIDDTVVPGDGYIYRMATENRVGRSEFTFAEEIFINEVNPLTSEVPPILFPGSPWPMYGKDPEHSSYLERSFSDGNYGVIWHRSVGVEWTRNPPVIDSRGIIYYCDSTGHLNAIDPGGSILWRFDTGSFSGDCAPCLDSEENIYFTAEDGFLYSVKTNGELRWKVRTGPFTSSSSTPIITSEGNILVGSGNRHVSCITTEGDVLWIFKSKGHIYSAPTISPFGNTYVAGSGGSLQGVDPTGEYVWNRTYEGNIPSTPSLNTYDNNLLHGARDGCLTCVNENGDEVWSCRLDKDFTYPPGSTPDGDIFLVTNDYSFMKISVQGKEIFDAPISHEHKSGSMVIFNNDRILVFDGSVSLFSADGVELWTLLEDERVVAGTVTGNGTIYAIGRNNEIWSIGIVDDPSESSVDDPELRLVLIIGIPFLSIMFALLIVMIMMLLRKRKRSRISDDIAS